jgi:hypothetical protein
VGGVVSADVTYTTYNGAAEACKVTYKATAISPLTTCSDGCGHATPEACEGIPIADEAIPEGMQIGCEAVDHAPDEVPEYFCVLVKKP